MGKEWEVCTCDIVHNCCKAIKVYTFSLTVLTVPSITKNDGLIEKSGEGEDPYSVHDQPPRPRFSISCY